MLKVLISLTSAIIIFGTTTSICGRITVRTFSSRKWTETGTARSRERVLSYAGRTSKRLDAIGSFHRLDRNHNSRLDPRELRSWPRR
jgi:hypothetical protein